MTKKNDWEIKNVDREKGIVTALCQGEEYSFTIIKDSLTCTSAKKLDEKNFQKYHSQLWAILSPLDIRSISGKSKEEKERIELLKSSNIHILPSGKLRILYHEGSRLIPHNYNDITRAIRAQQHISENYFNGNSENSEIIRIFSNISEVEKIREALFNWRKQTPNEIKSASDTLVRLGLNLKRCRDALKTEAREKLENSINFTDSIGRENPGASLAKTEAATRRLEKRIKKAQANDARARQRRQLLEIELRQMQLNIIEAVFKLKIILNSRDEFFQNERAVDQKLGQVLYVLQSVWLNPYFENIKEARKDIVEAKLKISKKEFNLARKFIAGAAEKLSAIR